MAARSLKLVLFTLLLYTWSATARYSLLGLFQKDGSCLSDAMCATYCVFQGFTVGQCSDEAKCTCRIPLFRGRKTTVEHHETVIEGKDHQSKETINTVTKEDIVDNSTDSSDTTDSTDPKEKEAKDYEIKDHEVKESDVKDDDAKTKEVKEAETKDTDVKDAEAKDDEAKAKEVKETETKDKDVKDAEAKDKDVKDAETKDNKTKKDAEKKQHGKKKKSKGDETAVAKNSSSPANNTMPSINNPASENNRTTGLDVAIKADNTTKVPVAKAQVNIDAAEQPNNAVNLNSAIEPADDSMLTDGGANPDTVTPEAYNTTDYSSSTPI
ncbi:uncharacterized protein BYT42DRAFT_614787 [Radiomyces spectabilis]|uniref:uncharacterized protein n=1 Tax=Radiomyces spectabilis TaxID=64574 RepID=UPI00221E4FF8|nr:uncharacterized protein BYT42DRAFT_614787 [Radiomyces spectabilis]KAI8376000.1 hypothetical protein BYT42DRAFT_614787 [Radiomyces spectabilis]